MCANVFIDLNWFSSERCGPWDSCYLLNIMTISLPLDTFQSFLWGAHISEHSTGVWVLYTLTMTRGEIVYNSSSRQLCFSEKTTTSVVCLSWNQETYTAFRAACEAGTTSTENSTWNITRKYWDKTRNNTYFSVADQGISEGGVMV